MHWMILNIKPTKLLLGAQLKLNFRMNQTDDSKKLTHRSVIVSGEHKNAFFMYYLSNTLSMVAGMVLFYTAHPPVPLRH
jgi:hypothetical protein